MIVFVYIPSRTCWLMTYDWRGGNLLCKLVKMFHTLAFQVPLALPSGHPLFIVLLERHRLYRHRPAHPGTRPGQQLPHPGQEAHSDDAGVRVAPGRRCQSAPALCLVGLRGHPREELESMSSSSLSRHAIPDLIDVGNPATRGHRAAEVLLRSRVPVQSRPPAARLLHPGRNCLCKCPAEY